MDNLFSIAKQMAEGIPDSEKEKIQNMDMNAMIQHVTKNVFSMMNDPDALKNNPLLAMASQEMKTPETFKDHTTSKSRKHKHRVEDIDDDDDDDESESILPKTKDLHFSINASLEDLYKGKNKKIAVKRKRLIKSKDGKYESHIEKKTITIPILPGTCDGHTITFEGEADELSGHKSGDIIITINENEHEIFERDGDNLLLVKDISLSESFGFLYKIKHLDGHVLELNSLKDDILHLHDGVRKIEGEGMPILEKEFDREDNDKEEEEDKKFGDLFMRFNLVLPEKIDKKYIETIKKIFPPLEDDIIEHATVIEDTTVVKRELQYVTEEDIEKLGSGYDSDDFSDDSEEESSDEEEESSDEEDESSDEEEESSDEEEQENEEDVD
jgi:DnaJ-class molecular chaperone